MFRKARDVPQRHETTIADTSAICISVGLVRDGKYRPPAERLEGVLWCHHAALRSVAARENARLDELTGDQQAPA
jgi:hypothetical protein